MKFIRCFITIILVYFSIQKASAQDLNQKLPIDASVKIGKLANGLTYYIRQNKKPENKAEMRLVVNAGSILEDDDQQGLAHFTEHMAFNGSQHFKKNELVNFLQNMGIEFGADLNAYTGFDETVYILPVPLTDTSNFRKGLSVLQDWAGGLSFDSDQIDGERGVVLEESRLGKGADDRMFRKIYPLQYEGSKYAERLPIGKDNILRNASYEIVKRFYKDYYRPNLMAVIIVGDIDVAETEKLIQEYFGALANPVNEKPRLSFTIPERIKSSSIVVTDNEATNFYVEVDYPFMALKAAATLGDYRNAIIKNLFGTLLNQRLSELTQSSNPPFLYASSGFSSYARGYEGFSSYAVAGNKGVDTALAVLLQEIHRVKVFGFTPNELERAKKQLQAYMDNDFNDRDKKESESFVQDYINHFLSREPVQGIEKEYNNFNQLLAQIKLAEINALTEKIDNKAPLFVSLQGPSKSDLKLPDDASLLANAITAMNTAVSPYNEKVIATSLFSELPKPGKLKSEVAIPATGVTELVYSNGVKVVLKPTDFKNDEIIMTSFHKGGSSAYPVEEKFTASYASAAVTQMGVGDFSPADLKKFLSGKMVSVSPRIGGIVSGISGSSGVKDFETLLQLTHLYSTAPRIDEALFNAWKEKQKAGLQFAMADPQNIFMDSLYRTLYQHNPLGPSGVPKPEHFDKINLSRAMEIYKEQLGDANDFTFIFTGSFNTDSIKPLLAEYLGSLPTAGKPATIKDNGVRPEQGIHDFTIYAGTEPKSMILTYYTGEIPYSEALELKANALSEILNIKIIEDLREKLGAIYGGGIYANINKYPYNSYSFILQLPCGPESVDTLIKSANMEIEKIKANGPEAPDLEKIKKAWLEQRKVQVKENSFWSSRLYNIYFNGNDALRIKNYEQLVNALTVEDIRQVANQLLSGPNIFKALWYPEKR